MARTESFIGLNNRAEKLVEGLLMASYGEFEGAFYNRFPLMAYHYSNQDSYTPNEVLYIEFIQASPWASGPYYFIALLNVHNGEKCGLWEEKEIEKFL